MLNALIDNVEAYVNLPSSPTACGMLGSQAIQVIAFLGTVPVHRGLHMEFIPLYL